MTLCLYFWIPLAWSFLSTFSALYYSVCFSCWMNKCKHLNLSSLHRKSFSRMMFSRRLQCGGKHLWPLLPGSLDPTDSTAKSACGPKTWHPVQLNIPKHNSKNTCPKICSTHVVLQYPSLWTVFFQWVKHQKRLLLGSTCPPPSIWRKKLMNRRKRRYLCLSVCLSIYHLFVHSFILYCCWLFVYSVCVSVSVYRLFVLSVYCFFVHSYCLSVCLSLFVYRLFVRSFCLTFVCSVGLSIICLFYPAKFLSFVCSSCLSLCLSFVCSVCLSFVC